jgi:hypothetical protein
MRLSYFPEGLRMLRRRIRVLFKGLKQYPGSAEQIADNIIKDCYNKEKKYFMISSKQGHFCEFYCRDFGWCTEALLWLGYRKEVLNTLSYALRIYEHYGKVEQAISSIGTPFTFPNKYSPDALAFLIRSLKLAKAHGLIKEHKDFLNMEIRRYYELVIDKEKGLVYENRSFSSMKDYAVRQSSCYDNVITGMLANDLQEIKILDNPFRKYDYKKIIIENFWDDKEGYFLDDLSHNRFICGDANVFPFWSGLITDKEKLRRAIQSIRNEGLDQPLPLKYTRKKFKENKMIVEVALADGYERDTVWAHIGLMYIKIVAEVDRDLARKYLEQYTKQIEQHHTFLELYNSKGKPFCTPLYYADEGMLWVANYLYLKNLL